MNQFKSLISLLILLSFLSCTEKEVIDDKIQKEIDYEFIYVGDEENPYTGKIVAKYENGNKKWEVDYVNGIKEGIQTDWYPNGEKKLEGMYINGKKYGVWIVWDEKGNNMETDYTEE
jgi:antitoxin component YwqK of YwqJK toxin-antitoxin module